MYSTPFSFRGVVVGAVQFETIFLFVPDDSSRAQELDVSLTRILGDGNISPDLIVFVYFEVEHAQIKPVLLSEHLTERLRSVQRCKAVYGAQIGIRGEIETVDLLSGQSLAALSLSAAEVFDAYRIGGMRLLSRRDGVVVSAAPGSFFLKPSGNRQTYFIRAALLCRTSVEASYVASLLIRAVASAKENYGDSPNVLLVDTLGIAYLAYALAEVSTKVGLMQRRPEIRSFGSYGGIEQIQLVVGQRPLFLISASTSGQLGKEIAARLGANVVGNSVSTLVGSFTSKYPSLIFKLTKDLLPTEPPTTEYFETLNEIRVHGEDFLFSPGKPNVVDLKRPQLPRDFSEQFSRIQGKGFIHHFKRVRVGKAVKPFLIHDLALVGDEQFTEWLRNQARLRIPIAVKRVIHQDDNASRAMGEKLLAQLKEVWGGAAPELTSISELEKLTPVAGEPVVVLAAVAGSGMELMRICRELRRYQPGGGRHFLIGALLARSYRQSQHVLSNLKKSVEPDHYFVSTWCAFSPARVPVEQMHARETALWEQVMKHESYDSFPTLLQNYVVSRKDLVEDRGMPADSIASPFISTPTESNNWSVGESFALWDHQFENRNCPVDVLFTVACWLQNARESGELRLADRLGDGGFQHSVIGPDCFLRFTDPVIQASILRCGQDSEFNYLTSDELSSRASEIIVKFFELREHSRVEFLFALAEGRMRLKPKHLGAVLAVAAEDPCGLTKLLARLTRERYLPTK